MGKQPDVLEAAADAEGFGRRSKVHLEHGEGADSSLIREQTHTHTLWRETRQGRGETGPRLGNRARESARR